MPAKPAILFVCLGNICRSPLAEGAFRAELARHRRVIEVDSAGTGDWHVGEPPDRRAIAVARRHGIDISGYRARQIEAADFTRFTHILALDRDNLENLKCIAPARPAAHIGLLMDFVPGREGEAVRDPYFGDASGFDITWSDVSLAARCLVAALGQ